MIVDPQHPVTASLLQEPVDGFNMDVDAATIETAAGTSESSLPLQSDHTSHRTSFLKSNSLLDQLDLRIHTSLRVLICIPCQRARCSHSIVSHLKGTHQVHIPPEQQQQLAALLLQERIYSGADVAAPAPRQAPIELLPIEAGLACTVCSYACRMQSSFARHWSDKHSDLPGKALEGCVQCSVQYLFQETRVMFQVCPELVPSTQANPYETFLSLHGSHLLPKPVTLAATQSREVPLMVQHTGWDLHLEAFTKSREDIQNVLGLIKVPLVVNQGSKLQLYHVVAAYYSKTRGLAANADFQVRKLLMECPLYEFIYCEFSHANHMFVQG